MQYIAGMQTYYSLELYLFLYFYEICYSSTLLNVLPIFITYAYINLLDGQNCSILETNSRILKQQELKLFIILASSLVASNDSFILHISAKNKAKLNCSKLQYFGN